MEDDSLQFFARVVSCFDWRAPESRRRNGEKKTGDVVLTYGAMWWVIGWQSLENVHFQLCIASVVRTKFCIIGYRWKVA